METKPNWPGTKRGAGVAERLINMIPPHSLYVCPFAGHCAVADKMRPAARRVFCDLDRDALRFWNNRPPAELFQTDGIAYVEHLFELRRLDRVPTWRGDAFVFVDPPYYPGTCGRGIYKHELSEAEHVRLLDVLVEIPAPVMLAGYRCELYDQRLADWRRIDYQVPTRGGHKMESVYLNYPPPDRLHDPRFIGSNKRERERIRRRQRNLAAMLRRLPAVERQALLDVLQS